MDGPDRTDHAAHLAVVRPWRLAIVVPGFGAADPDWCIPAVSTFTRELARTRPVSVVALRYPDSARPYEAHGARVYPVGLGNVQGLDRVRMFRRATGCLRDLHRERPVDAVMAIGADEAGVIATQFGARIGVPSVVMLLGGEAERRLDLAWGGRLSRVNGFLLRRAVRRADVLMAGSALAADRVREVTGRRPDVWGFGVDGELFSPTSPALRPLYRDDPTPRNDPERFGDPNLLTVASLTPVKNPLALATVIEQVRARYPSARLHVVGEGPDHAALVEELTRRDLLVNVRFPRGPHGSIPLSGMPRWYARATLLVVASHVESQGMAIEEAAAMGCVPVGSRVGVMPELHAALGTDGTRGPSWLALPGDADALAAAVLEALSDRDRLQHASRVCLKWAASRTAARRVMELDAKIWDASPERVRVAQRRRVEPSVGAEPGGVR